ncbi:MAG: DNA translocase FtsK [Pseudomonadota bacterium]
MSDIDYSGETQFEHGGMQALLRRQALFLTGCGLVCLTAFAGLSLIFWDVADPSLSNATSAPVTNLMGGAGAVLADLLMQFFGLGAFLLLLIGLSAGYALIRGHVWTHLARRLAIVPVALFLMSAVFASVVAPASWPLPTGLGGAFGDLLMAIPGMLVGGYPTGVYGVLIGAVLLLPALYAAAIACGLFWVDVHEDSDDETGFGQTAVIGALMHGLYALRASVFRRLPGFGRSASGDGKTKRKRGKPRPEDGIPADAGGLRVEPDLDIFVRDDDFGPPVDLDGHAAPPVGDGVMSEVETAQSVGAADVAPSATGHTVSVSDPAKRVVAPAAPPKPSVRVQRDAQPSLISDGAFELPSIHLLNEAKNIIKDDTLSDDALEQNARLLEGVLEDFGVRGEIIQVRPGPVVTLYELEPAPGIKSSRVIGLAEDIARSMSAIAARVAVVPGRNAIGIELPNQRRETVYLRELVSSQNYEKAKAKLGLTLGKTINGEAVIADLAKMPHLLVAGTTGSGKSVAINTMILSLLYKMTPEQCRLIMIDPKMLELSVYDGIPHLLTPVVTDPKKAVVALKWTVREMEQRYKNMSKLGVRNIDGFNTRVKEAIAKGEDITRTVQTGFDRETGEAVYETEILELEPMPYIVVIIDEMADLMMVAGKEIEGAVQRLAQMARAAGIHVIMATQRPSVDVITGTIKANFPTRISFQVTSKIDSRTILGEQGAEQLLGMGDMLYMAGGGRIQRVHGPFVSDEEVEDIVKHLKAQGVPQYLDAVTEDDDEDGELGGDGGGAAGDMGDSDDPYDQAVAVVLRDRKVSTSYIQRRLGIGYNRAATLIERMEEEGLIGPANHAGKRDILVPSEEEQIAGMG